MDAILIVDGDGKMILQNKRMVELWEIPAELAEEADNQGRLDWITRQNKNPAKFLEQVEYLYAHPDEIGHDELELTNGKFFDRYSAPVRDKEGKHYGRIWSYRDITERKQSEQQIVEQASFLDKAQDAILVRDLDGRVIFWNHGAEKMYGLSRLEVVGQLVSELYYTDPKKFDEANSQTIQRGEWSGELIHLTRDQREINVEARWTLIRDNDGLPKSVLAINTDITEKKKTEIQFLRAQRMESIGTLAGGIAHDLNNILAPIMMSIDLLKTTAEDPQAQKMLETIDVSAKRGAAIVRQVLSFARGMEGERIEIQPTHLLKDLEHIIKDTFPKNVRLQFWNPNDIWTISGDPTQVQQILLNLCVNARDAMPNGGDLTVSVKNRTLDEQYAAMNGKVKAGVTWKSMFPILEWEFRPSLSIKYSIPFSPRRKLARAPAWASPP